MSKVGRCKSNPVQPVLKVPVFPALELAYEATAFKVCFHSNLWPYTKEQREGVETGGRVKLAEPKVKVRVRWGLAEIT